MVRAAALATLCGGRDEFVCGVSWVPPANIVETVASLGLDLAFVPDAPPDAERLVAEVQALDAAAVWVVDGALGVLADSLGWADALRLTAAGSSVLAPRLTDSLARAVASVRRGAEAGADVVLVADDLAGAGSALVSPDFVADVLAPWYRRVAEEMLACGVLAGFHSDGDVRETMPLLRDAGYSVFHVAGVAREMLAPTIEAARASGFVAMGGIVSAGITEDPASSGRFAGCLAHDRGLIVCDDGGLVTTEEFDALRIAVAAARTAFAQSPDRSGSRGA